jgi:hypothetical protein
MTFCSGFWRHVDSYVDASASVRISDLGTKSGNFHSANQIRYGTANWRVDTASLWAWNVRPRKCSTFCCDVHTASDCYNTPGGRDEFFHVQATSINSAEFSAMQFCMRCC